MILVRYSTKELVPSLFDPIKSGDKIYASVWDALRRIALRFVRFTVATPLQLIQTPSGYHLNIALPEEFWAKVTGGSNPYAWTEQIPVASGGWTAGTRTGTTTTNSAYEVNNNTGVPVGTFVRLEDRQGGSKYLFLYSKCGG